MVKLLVSKLVRVRWAGVARVALYLMLVNFGISYLLMRSAYAGAEKTVRRLGDELTKELGSKLLGEPQAVSVNGQLLFLATKQTDLSVKSVLDQFDSSCVAHSGGLREEFAKMPGFNERKLALPVEMRDPGRIGVIRSDGAEASESETEAHLVCVAQPEGTKGVAGVIDHVNEFLKTGDVSRIGEMRYVKARKLDNGKTQVIAIWTEGKFNIEAMFPDEGDVPGSDTPGLPRPPSSTRKLSAVVPDHPYAVRSYDAAAPRADVLAFYDQRLAAAGWEQRPAAMGEREPEMQPADARVFTREGRAVVIAASEDGPNQTGLTIIELGNLERVVTEAATR